MSERDHMDDLMKSILEGGREEVPSHIWEGIEAGLDKAARRKAVVVWFRRAGAVAAAAAIAIGVILNPDKEDSFVPAANEENMIAVVQDEVNETETIEEMMLLADAGDLPSVKTFPVDKETGTAVIESCNEEVTASDNPDPSTVIKTEQTPQEPLGTPYEESDTYMESSDWEEEDSELKEGRLRTSLVLSGIAGTNNPQKKSGYSIMKSPVLGKIYSKSTVEQTSTEIRYGIPLSLGAGVRLHFTERWSLGLGLNYTLLSSRFEGKYIKVTEESKAETPVSGKVRNTQHYIGIPVNAYYNIVSHDFINFYAYAGGTVEKCVANKYQIQAGSVINHSESVKSVQLSANAGIGVELMLGKHAGIYIDPSLRYYFRNGQPKSIRTSQPLMLGFEVGLRFNL